MDPISVPLRLDLTQLPEDIAGAKAIIKAAFPGGILESSGSKGASGSPELEREVRNIQQEVRRGSPSRAREALDKISSSGSTPFASLGGLRGGTTSKDQWKSILSRMSPEDRAFYEGKGSEQGGGGGGVVGKAASKLTSSAIGAEDKAKKAAARVMSDRANFMKDMSFLMMPLMNPGSVWATLFSTRQTFSAFSKTATGKGMVGGTLGGAAMATGVLVGAATVLGVALMGLKKIVSETGSEFEYARSSYAKSLMSGGLGVGFSIRRAALADILGVSEKDVFKFGLQVQYLNERLKTSTSILSQYNPTLTETGWSMKLFWQDLKAFGAVLAARAPVQGAIKKIDEGTKAFAQAFQTRDMVKDMREYAKIHGFGLSEPGLKAAFKMSPEEYRSGLKFTSGINNPLDDQRARFETWSAQKHRGNIPPAMAFMDQLGTSKWEKMGLVIGGGMGAQNHLRQIVVNTKKTADAVGKWASAIPRSGGFSANPAYNSP